MNKLKFTYGKQFGLKTGGIITMKALITITTPEYSDQLVECHEDDIRRKADDLIELSSGAYLYNFEQIDISPSCSNSPAPPRI
jgi:hypothetical protein